ncbi:MAG: tetratricopeptide repeat protein [Bacteroidia bacterium]
MPATLLLAQTAKKAVPPLTGKQQALLKAKQAQALMDAGKADEAISLLEACSKLDSGNVDYPYERAYAWSTKKEDSIAFSILDPLLERPNTTDVIYELAGNCLEKMSQQDRAFTVYKNGLAKFPSSARLDLECGQIEMEQKQYNRALVYFEKGIEADPAFSSNYYWASKLFCHSSEPVWGMIYGELFVLLERGGKRSDEISKLLFDTYKSQIHFRADSTFTLNFSKQSSATGDTTGGKKARLPFGVGFYEPAMGIALNGEYHIDLNSLNRIRKRFLESYFSSASDKKYPNVLFDFQHEVMKAGQMEAYNHWLLMEGDMEAFKIWHKSNTAKWVSFGKWLRDHPLKLDKLHKFYRGQYE